MAEDEDALLCETCGNTREWHEDFKPHHEYVPKGGPGAGKLNAKKKDKDKDAVPVRVATMPAGDPALRIALVRAGVIKYEDVVMAEEELRAASQGGRAIIIEGPDDRGDGPGVPEPGGSSGEDPRDGNRGGPSRGVRDPGERDAGRKGRKARQSG